MVAVKTCSKCYEILPATVEYFNRDRQKKDGLCSSCNQCCRRRMKESKRLHEGKKRDAYYRREYGISVKEYDALLEKQDGRCAICGKHQIEFPRRLDIDHDHKTGEVRGLLCWVCNTLLGRIDDNIIILRSAIKYLEGKQQ